MTHVNGDKVDLGVTVLSSLGGGHVDDLAGSALDHDVTVLPEGRALHADRQSFSLFHCIVPERVDSREGGGGTGPGGLEGLVVLVVGHFLPSALCFTVLL